MADFLSNLLSRSGAVPGTKPAPVLQPRLPALFEATGNPEGISAPPPTPVEAASLPQPVESRESLPRPAPLVPPLTGNPLPDPQTLSADRSRPVLPVTPAPEVHPARSSASPARPTEVFPEPPRTIRGEAPLADSRTSLTPRPIQPAGEEPLPETARRSRRRELPIRSEAAESFSKRDMGQGSRLVAMVERKPTQVDRPSGPLNSVVKPAERQAASLQKESIPVNAVRESVLQQQALPVVSRPAVPQSVVLPETDGPVVQIHIGRIEVRAVTPSAPVPASRPRPAGPKLSLEEYLHQREGKR
jgi:hypothetical protein